VSESAATWYGQNALAHPLLSCIDSPSQISDVSPMFVGFSILADILQWQGGGYLSLIDMAHALYETELRRLALLKEASSLHICLIIYQMHVIHRLLKRTLKRVCIFTLVLPPVRV
jgi:hypothetical protein